MSLRASRTDFDKAGSFLESGITAFRFSMLFLRRAGGFSCWDSNGEATSGIRDILQITQACVPLIAQTAAIASLKSALVRLGHHLQQVLAKRHDEIAGATSTATLQRRNGVCGGGCAQYSKQRALSLGLLSS